MFAFIFTLLAELALAQSAVPGSTLAWDQSNTDAVSAQAYTYKYYADGSSVGVVLTGVVCSGSAPVSCTAPFPAFTPGQHSLQLTATNAAGESVKSSPFAFTFVVVPSAPANIRIQ